MLDQEKIATPSTPAANFSTLYVDTVDMRRKEIDDKGTKNVLTPMGWRDNNIIINGEFDYAQRQVPGTLTTYSNTTGRTYAADRWGMTNENASIQFQRIDTSSATEVNLNARFYGKYKKITGVGKMFISQVIESGNIMHLRGRTVRVQAKLRCSVASAMNVRLGLIQLANAGTIDAIPATFLSAFGAVGTDPTPGTNLAYIAPNASPTGDGGTINGNALDCALTVNWVRFSATFTVPSNCKNLVMGIWTNGQPAVNDELNISEVGIYEGHEIRDWFPRIQGDQFARCQRYYQKTFAPDTTPAQNGGVSGALRGQVAIAGAVATSSTIQWRFVIPMFKTPTLTFYNPSAANAFLRNIGAGTDATATSGANITSEAADVNATGLAAWVAGQEIKVHASADGEL